VDGRKPLRKDLTGIEQVMKIPARAGLAATAITALLDRAIVTYMPFVAHVYRAVEPAFAHWFSRKRE